MIFRQNRPEGPTVEESILNSIAYYLQDRPLDLEGLVGEVRSNRQQYGEKKIEEVLTKLQEGGYVSFSKTGDYITKIQLTQKGKDLNGEPPPEMRPSASSNDEPEGRLNPEELKGYLRELLEKAGVGPGKVQDTAVKDMEKVVDKALHHGRPR